jgi:two-component system response regulator LytT
VNIVVIEDEAPSLRKLVDMLAVVAPGARVMAELGSVDDVVGWLSGHPPPDLVFADIELRDGRVFEAFRRARSPAPVIFTTAYDRFLLDAFRSQGIGYLLKPFGEPELAGALARYHELRRSFARSDDAPLERLLRQLSVDCLDHRRHFTVKLGRRVHILPLDRVALVVLGPAGVEIIDRQGKSHMASGDMSLAEVERGLPPAGFFRINRNEIVALGAIDHLAPDGDRITIAVTGLQRSCAVGVHRAAAFRKWVGLGRG